MIVLGGTPEPDAALKILTPWWDVLTRYLTAGIMTIALSTAALQAAKDNLVCTPAVDCIARQNFVTPTAPYRDVCDKVHYRLTNDSNTTVITTMADYRQYSFLDTLCFQTIFSWYATYFPFILVAEALVLLLIDNFWIMYPKTSSALNHFVTLTMECYSSVGTHLDIFQLLSKTKKPTDDKKGSPDEVPEVKVHDKLSQACDESHALLMEQIETTSKAPPSPPPPNDKMDLHFDVSGAMKVKTLYDKVDKFIESYGSNHRLLIWVYRMRAVLQILLCIFILAFNFYYYGSLNNVVKCHLNVVFVTKYEYFMCARYIAPYYRAITLIFAAAAVIYLITIIYAFIWCERNARNHDVFKDVPLVDDRVHVEGDLAFLFSLLEHYNKLYSDRLVVFLSQGLKASLDTKICNHKTELALKQKPAEARV